MKPTPTPFWEQAKGSGPITKWHNSREELEARIRERDARRANPLVALSRLKMNSTPTTEESYE